MFYRDVQPVFWYKVLFFIIKYHLHKGMPMCYYIFHPSCNTRHHLDKGLLVFSDIFHSSYAIIHHLDKGMSVCSDISYPSYAIIHHLDKGMPMCSCIFHSSCIIRHHLNKGMSMCSDISHPSYAIRHHLWPIVYLIMSLVLDKLLLDLIKSRCLFPFHSCQCCLQCFSHCMCYRGHLGKISNFAYVSEANKGKVVTLHVVTEDTKG